ncbi:MAG: glycoside hydrolase family 20 zincin-like fold domain-containing protein [Verrucomicrobiota bacterium]
MIVCLGVAGLLWVAARDATAQTNTPGATQDLRLVPFPKSVALEAGRFSLKQPLTFEISDGQGELPAQLLNIELQRAGLPPAQVSGLKSAGPAFRLAVKRHALILPDLPQQASTESYALDVRPDEIVGAAKDPAGLFFGLQTLCQLIRANRQGDTLPCLQIRDWPSLRWRCFQDDMTRGPSSTLDTLKFEASMASYLKLNLMTYYMEYQFAFKKHPNIGPTNGSLTPQDLSALVAYAKPLHLDVLGNQQSFGHFGQILSHPEYKDLRETPDVLTPVREQTYQFLNDLYSEVCPLLTFPWFNVCCDETDGLGTGPSRELAASIGVGGVYVRHIRRIHDLLRDQHHKRMMMWGDIILQHPANLAEVPKDTIMLSWGYDARDSFESQITPFAKSGYDFFVCPGVSDWSRILPDFGVAVTNIHNFVRDGVKHGASGMINTDWEDDGEALKAVKWHADAWAAECAWNASATPLEAFNRRVGAVLFGERGDNFGQAVALLTQTHRLPAMKNMMNSRFWEQDFVPKAGPAATQATATNVLAIVRPALAHLQICREEAKCNQHVLEVFLFGARRMEFIGQRMLDGLEAAQSYEQARQAPGGESKLGRVERLIRKNRDTYERLGREFAALWLSESRPYALDWTLRRYTNAVNECDALLRKVEAARVAAAAGQPLPPADELGLAAPKPYFRRVRPAGNSPEALAPASPWADATATHRLGLVVRTEAADRFDLPIEVELALPADLAGKPVRAFLIGTNEPPRELLAQLDRLDSQGKARLILMLPGPLPREAEASVHVYLGLSQAPAPLPTAVSTTDGTNGMRWIENDQVRLLLGPEGAHVYRWEVKAAGNRDLTMPGESDWHGFSDLHPHRNAQYQLNCRAHGPAMVEYESTDPWGHTKILRLYGGASWTEELLNEPATVFWDFDNPKNFASDGPTPGQWLFSNGQTGPVGREADGVPAQVKAPNTYWGIKHSPERLALGLVTPETAAQFVIAPGAGAGGVGIEGSPPALHFVTFAGLLTAPPADTMNRLRTTLDLKHPVGVRLHSVQAR